MSSRRPKVPSPLTGSVCPAVGFADPVRAPQLPPHPRLRWASALAFALPGLGFPSIDGVKKRSPKSACAAHSAEETRTQACVCSHTRDRHPEDPCPLLGLFSRHPGACLHSGVWTGRRGAPGARSFLVIPDSSVGPLSLRDSTPHQRDAGRPGQSDTHRAPVGAQAPRSKGWGKTECPASYSLECERSDCVCFVL